MNIQYIFELVGTAFFAISGAIAAAEKADSDWFGVTFIAFITAIGGGSIRDMLLGSYPLVWINNIQFVYAIIVGVILSFFFFNTFKRIPKTFFLFDTLGIALFTIIGTEKTMLLGFHPVIAAIMGMFTAVMGGVIRDVLTNEIPIIFRKEIYATACLAGATLFLGLDYYWDLDRTWNFILSGLLILVIRIIAVKWRLSLPKFGETQKSDKP
jgi:uncharacterized membrane protein YeiH